MNPARFLASLIYAGLVSLICITLGSIEDEKDRQAQDQSIKAVPKCAKEFSRVDRQALLAQAHCQGR